MDNDRNKLSREPLHKQISDRLRREIVTEFAAGDRFGSQNELAARFQVSPITIREAVNALVQEGLVERRKGAGTYVLDRRGRQAVAILAEVDLTRPNTSWFFLRLVQMLERYFTEHDVLARSYIGHAAAMTDDAPELPTSRSFWADYEKDNLCALVPLGYNLSTAFLQKLDAAGIVPVQRGSSVELIDYGQVAAAAALAMAGTGARRIALLQHGGWQAVVARELQRHGLSLDPAWVVRVGVGHEFETATAAFRHVWQAKRTKPDGLIVLDDVLYHGLSPMLLASDIRVPEDLAVVSHANRGDPQPMRPAPIRVEIDPDECARALGVNMLRRLDDAGAELVDLPVSIRVAEPAPCEDEELLLT